MSDSETIIEIEEYKSKDVDNLNEERDIPYLKKSCFAYETLSPYEITPLRDNKVRIKNTSYSGIIQLDRYRIHFSTKVKTNLFYMLSLLKDEKSFLYDPEVVIDIKEGENFFDILGRLFLNELESIFERGFYKKYVPKEENTSFLKGKLLFRKQLQNNINKRPKFYCSYGDLTFDNLENQIVLKASTLLVPLIKFNEEIKHELMRFNLLLREEVNLVDMVPEDCNRIQYSKLNEYYEPIIQFSKVILQNYFIRSVHKGLSRGFNFIVNMNKVYEDFVTKMVEEIVSTEVEFQDYVLEKQEKFNSLVKDSKIITRPDIILRKKDTKDEYPLLIDAKYKRQENNADYYQVIAYALAIPSVKTCCLIYPAEEPVEKRSLILEASKFGYSRPDVRLQPLIIDLHLQENLSFKKYIDKIEKELKGKLIACL